MKKEICRKISDFFGGNLRIEGGVLTINKGAEKCTYADEDQLLYDWADILVECQYVTDRERYFRGLEPNRCWGREIAYIYRNVLAKPKIFEGISAHVRRGWEARFTTRSTSVGDITLYLGVYNSIVDAIYARKAFRDECIDLLCSGNTAELAAKARAYKLQAEATFCTSPKAHEPIEEVSGEKGIIVTVIKNAENDEVWDDAFFYTGEARKEKEVKAELVKAIKEYLISEDGDKALADACHDFNWNDGYAPDTILNRYGFRRIYDGENHAIRNVDIVGSVAICVSAYEFPEIEVTPVLWVKDVRGNMHKLFPEENDGCYDVDIRNQHISVDARNEAAAASLAGLCPMDALFVEFDGNGVYHSVALPEKKPTSMTRDYYLMDFDHLG